MSAQVSHYRGMILKNQNLQVKQVGGRRAKSLQINKAVPAGVGKAALTTPEILYVQGTLFLWKSERDQSSLCQAQAQVIKCLLSWHPGLTWTKATSWPLN